MHVGYSLAFQNLGNQSFDHEVYERELRLADLAVDLGFESIWTVEHHFTDYLMSPDPVQLLTWLAARHPHILLGTGVIVLPWHEPVRCAEQIALLDNLSDGRLILGLGRGIAKHEYDGFRVDMDSSRQRFISYTKLILEGHERGYLEADDEFVTIPRREIRPRPRFSLQGRAYAGAMSPEAMPIMAELGIGLLTSTATARRGSPRTAPTSRRPRRCVVGTCSCTRTPRSHARPRTGTSAPTTTR
jgi:alkanesulfonate monooxygenase SsuD/methylene tetrahydromethanopterin reductase-like flavin-dependent oxidoreductase (luciferase family)